MYLTKQEWIDLRKISMQVSRRMGETAADADDDAQEALVKISAVSATNIADKERYIVTITKNIINDRYRRSIKNRTFSIDEARFASIIDESDKNDEGWQKETHGMADELYCFFALTSSRKLLYEFIFDKYILNGPALNLALREYSRSHNAVVLPGGVDAISEWRIPPQLKIEVANLKSFLTAHKLNLNQLLDLLKCPEFVFSSENLTTMTAAVCKNFIAQLTNDVQRLKISAVLRANSGTHNFKINMQQAFWMISKIVYNLSAINQRYYILGGMQFMRRRLSNRFKHSIADYDKNLNNSAWEIVSACFKYDLFRNTSEEWIAVELLGLIPEYTFVPVDKFVEQMTSVIKRVKHQRTLPTLGAAWSCANVNKLPKYSSIHETLTRAIDLVSWPGGQAAHPMILVTPHLSCSFTTLRSSLNNGSAWDVLIRTLSSTSDVAKLGAIWALMAIPSICCPLEVKELIGACLLRTKLSVNKYIQEKIDLGQRPSGP